MVDHVLAFLQQRAEERRYRAYVTDALRLAAENTAKLVGGSYIASRWIDHEIPQNKGDERSGDEIAADIITRLGLKFSETGDTNG